LLTHPFCFNNAVYFSTNCWRSENVNSGCGKRTRIIVRLKFRNSEIPTPLAIGMDKEGSSKKST